MSISDAVSMLLLFQLLNGQMNASNAINGDISNTYNSTAQNNTKPMFVSGKKLDIFYWNSHLGNDKPIKIMYNNVTRIQKYWSKGLPLKIITHGWLASDKNFTGVFDIKTAYVKTGGFNVITIDWSIVARDIIYPTPAHATEYIGSLLATFLKNLIQIICINPVIIHLIGHSLGAHVVGSCGSYFKSPKIGRITGLDPAAPGFENIPIHLPHLNSTNAKFVDVIHTTAGSVGFIHSIGHVDFYPNSGRAPQPGCDSLLNLFDFIKCSHAYSYELYTYSVYHKKSLISVNCSSWSDFKHNKCINNTKIFMGHDATPSARGKFYLKTNQTGVLNILKLI